MWNTFQHSAPHCCVHHLPGFPHAAVTRGLGPVHHPAQHEAAQTWRAGGEQRRSRSHHRAQLERESQDLHVNICTLTPWNITNPHKHREGDTLTLSVDVGTFDLPADQPPSPSPFSCSSLNGKSILDCLLISNITAKVEMQEALTVYRSLASIALRSYPSWCVDSCQL